MVNNAGSMFHPQIYSISDPNITDTELPVLVCVY